MLILWMMLGSMAVLLGGGLIYARIIGRALGERPNRPTPAVLVNDGRDYVPTRTPVVFAHHFASIAGAGPIIGPVLALLYGWGPALAWLLAGAVLLGGVHDYVALHITMREGGRNLTVVARRTIGRWAFVMMLILLVALLALVCAAFLDLSAVALVSTVPADALQLPEDQTLFALKDGQAAIGGIAFTSVLFITACSPLVGFLYLKRKTPVWLCSVLAMALCTVSILVGMTWPLSVEPSTWKVMVSAYVLLAAGLPVWLFLQSRDFINVHILYVGIAFLLVSLIASAFRGGGELASRATAIPFNNWSQAGDVLGPGWPVMFVIIACGAVSGFHGLCAGGTTCKQLNNERSARTVGYFGLLLESFLAVCVVGSLVVGLSLASYKGYCYPAPDSGVQGNMALAFAMAVGHTAHIGLSLPVWVGAVGAMLMLQGFLVTTLDTAIRLTRYMIEEGWVTLFGHYDVFADRAAKQRALAADASTSELAGTGGLSAERPDMDGPQTPVRPVATRGLTRLGLSLLKHYWFNSGIAVALMLVLGWGSGYKVVWKIFSSGNQLLAALTLLVASVWLYHRGRAFWFTLAPSLFMLATSVTMLTRLLVLDYWPNRATELPLLITSVVVLAMTVGIVVLAIIRSVRSWNDKRQAASAAPV